MAPARVFLPSQPTRSSESCSKLPRHGLGCWAVCRRRLRFLLPAVHRMFATKPASSETSKAETVVSANHGSIGDSWPIAFSGYPRGPRVGCEAECPSTSCLTSRLRPRSRTRVSQEPHGHHQRRFPGWSDSVRDTQAVCGFRYSASKRTPFF
jgi:hypothetical protein